MKSKTTKGNTLLSVFAATVLFSFLRMILSFFPIVPVLIEWGWSLLAIIIASTVLQMISAGFAVLVVMPIILGSRQQTEWIPGLLRMNRNSVMMGVSSFLVFCVLATVISVGMGIFEGDPSAVLGFPDLEPDPDVIGWGYFLLALVPGIWEELAFRGLVLSKIRRRFSIPAAIFLSSAFFALFHLSNLLTQPPTEAIPGVVMSFFFGIGWGTLVVRTGSVLPGMISHYLVDCFGQVFLNVNTSDPAMTTGFFLLLTLLFPVFNILLASLFTREPKLGKQVQAFREG